jgi:hypothetical protein
LTNVERFDIAHVRLAIEEQNSLDQLLRVSFHRSVFRQRPIAFHNPVLTRFGGTVLVYRRHLFAQGFI